jgi:multidrug resistance efflux pump
MEAKGYVTPIRQSRLAPAFPGILVETSAEEGKEYAKGAVLGRIDPVPYELACRRARAVADRAKARLEALRRKRGAEDAEREAQLDVEVAEADLRLAEYRLGQTVVRAPFGGTVLSRRAEVGSRVDSASGDAYYLCDFADLKEVEVDLCLSLRDLPLWVPGRKCTIRCEVIPGVTYEGKVSRLLPTADRAKGARSVRVGVDVPKGDRRLLPDLDVIVRLDDDEAPTRP